MLQISPFSNSNMDCFLSQIRKYTDGPILDPDFAHKMQLNCETTHTPKTVSHYLCCANICIHVQSPLPGRVPVLLCPSCEIKHCQLRFFVSGCSWLDVCARGCLCLRTSSSKGTGAADRDMQLEVRAPTFQQKQVVSPTHESRVCHCDLQRTG